MGVFLLISVVALILTWITIYLTVGLVVLVVGNIVSVSVPALIELLGFLLRIEDRQHAVVEERFWFDKVDYVKYVLSAFTRVAYFEIKPLCIALSAIVRLQYQLVFIFV